MIEFIAVNMAPIMFFSLIIFLLLGYPVAFSLAANGLLFFVIGVELAPLSNGTINLSWPLLYALPERFYGGVMANETLLAIPFFTFMGIVLERSGMAEDLLDTIGQLFGPVRGGHPVYGAATRETTAAGSRSSRTRRWGSVPPSGWLRRGRCTRSGSTRRAVRGFRRRGRP